MLTVWRMKTALFREGTPFLSLPSPLEVIWLESASLQEREIGLSGFQIISKEERRV